MLQLSTLYDSFSEDNNFKMFDPEEFLKRPPQEILDTLKALSLTRDELVVLARHLEIEPKTSSTKPEIRQLILPVLVTKNIVGEESDEKTEEKRRHRNQYNDGKNP